MFKRAREIATEQPYSKHLGIELVELEQDRTVLKLPYREELGLDRVNGGAISSLIDLAATSAFWSHPTITDNSRGATVSLTVNFLRLSVATDLRAFAKVRRRGGTICVGEVSVRDIDHEEVAFASVTYKLEP